MSELETNETPSRPVPTPLPPARRLADLLGALPATRTFPGHDAIRQKLHAELGRRIAQGDE
jgi:hypothetical protein